MKKVLLLIVTIALIAGGYWLYIKYIDKSTVRAWDLVPSSALLLYESDQCSSCRDNALQSTVWKIIEEAAFYQRPVDSLKKQIEKFLDDRGELLVSVHAITKDNFDFVYYSPISEQAVSSLDLFSKNPPYQVTTRSFNAVEVHDLQFLKHTFSWAIIENIWVGSFSSVLIEDVIRTFKANKPTFQQDVSSVLHLQKIKDDVGNLYVKLDNLSELLSVFSMNAPIIGQALGKALTLDVKSDGSNFVLNGFSTDSVDNSKYLLSIFRNQDPVSFNLKNYISQKTLALQTFGVSNGALFAEDREAFVQAKNSALLDSLNALQRHGLNAASLYRSISNEVAVCFIEKSRSRNQSRILVVETNDLPSWTKSLNALSNKLSKDTVFVERYGGYEIREAPVFRLPEKLFWPLVSGFDQSFYTYIGNHVVIGDDLEELKSFLNDVDNEETWGRSVEYNHFLESTLLESNLSLYINTSKIFNLISSSLHPRWKQFIKDNRSLINSIQSGAIQFSHLNNSYYTSISLSYKNENSKPTRRDKFVTRFDSPITGLYHVKSHVNRTDEFLVQDSLFNLALVSTEGEVLWKVAIGERIASEVSQIDFYGNGKLQYFFATPTALHIIDRLGNYVNPYPLKLSGMNVTHASVIDYDHSKKYRFLIAEVNGKLWMYDKDGKNLEGWQPKEIGGSLLAAPQHHRIKGRDYITAVRKDGVVYVMNRRGEDLKNFPLNIQSRLRGNYFLEIGSTLQETYFVVVSSDGYKIKFNPEGKIQSKETLLKTSVATEFTLIPERSSKSYLVLQQDDRHFNLLDENGKQIITNEYVGSHPSSVKVYDFGSDQKIVSVVDHEQELAYVYNTAGDLVTLPPIQTNLLEVRPSTSGYKVFYIKGNSMVIEPLD